MRVNEPLILSSGVELKNRLFFAPISTLDSTLNGLVSTSELNFFARRTGDVAAIVVASAYVSSAGKAYEHGLGVSHDSQLSSLKQLAKTIQHSGTKAFLQLYHGGGMTYFVKHPRYFCVSQESENLGSVRYEELDEEGIEAVIQDYEQAIIRAIKAGFDGVEIHASNSYLPQQFLMPSWNQREDRWGGCLVNRLRFLSEIIERGKRVIENHATQPFALGVRLSLEDTMVIDKKERQQSFYDSLLIIQALNDYPLDYLHVTSQDILQRVMMESQSVDLLGILKVMSPNVPIIGCGNLLQSVDIEKALGQCQLVSACRPFVLQPEWAKLVIEEEPIELAETELTGKERQRLVIPRRLWKSVQESADWYHYR